ncbi:MAG TPA: M28 family peptidase, partial [Gemmatimonadaceae bacterium]|nr:M28 family peptidase [Gemmatimonadaceae bacterium]
HTLGILTVMLALLAPASAQAQGSEQSAPVVPLPATRLPRTHQPRPTSSAISAADLMTRLYIFADDSMQGREAGTIGSVKSTAYIAAELKRMGLKPAGDSGTYFQVLPFKVRSVDTNSVITVGDAKLPFGREWGSSPPSDIILHDQRIVYGGVLGDSSFIPLDSLKGKVVVARLSPTNIQGGLRVIGEVASKSSGIMVVGPAQFLPFFTQPQQFLDVPGASSGPLGSLIYLSDSAAAHLFESPLGTLAVGGAGKPVNVEIRVRTEPSPYPARNVVAILPGSDSRLRGQYVAIGAHTDHIGLNHTPVDHDSIRIYNHIVRPGGAEQQGARATPDQQVEVSKELAAWRAAHPGEARIDSISNGADDDGSGTVTVLEIAQRMASLRPAPKRSMLFVFHVGEEKGLLGSMYFTDHPTVPRDSIVAQLNMDMVGRGDAWDQIGTDKSGKPLFGGPRSLMLVGSRRLSTELGDIVERVNTEGKHGLVFDYSFDANGHPENIYCRSDHYEYARYGIPIVFFTTGVHSDYHQVTDEPEYIDYDHMARIASFIEDVALHVANLDHRVVVDHPKPDPHGACQQ